MNFDKEELLNKGGKLWKFFVKHKYITTLILFLVYISFIDQTSLLFRYNQKKNLKTIELELENYKKNTLESERRVNDLKNDSRNVEKLAREKYYFKKDNEDVFVIVDNSEK